MEFFKRFMINLALLAAAGLLLLIFFPDIMRSAYSLLGALFGPLLILIVIVAALPNRRRR